MLSTSKELVLIPNGTPNAIIKVKDNSAEIKVYPNPNNGNSLFIASETKQSLSIIQVYNVLGEQVLTETLRSAQGGNSINITGQPSGVYFYRVSNNDGSLIGEGKFVISK